MKNISFALTTTQVRARSKTVTRRLGWKTLKHGELLQACEKCQGLKPGERLRHICVVRVVKVTREPLTAIVGHDDDCAKEGFPDLSCNEFIGMFCRHMKCVPETEVTRIEFEYL